MQVLEAIGEIDKNGQIRLDQPLNLKGQKVNVIILLQEEAEINDAAWIKVIQSSSSFDFLKDSKEDIYTIADGKPINNEA